MKLHRLVDFDPGRETLRDLGGDLQRVDADHAHHRHLRLDQLPQRDQPPLHVAVERRADDAVAQLPVGELHARIRRVDVGLQVPAVVDGGVVGGLLRPQHRLGIVELLLRNQLALV